MGRLVVLNQARNAIAGEDSLLGSEAKSKCLAETGTPFPTVLAQFRRYHSVEARAETSQCIGDIYDIAVADKIGQ